MRDSCATLHHHPDANDGPDRSDFFADFQAGHDPEAVVTTPQAHAAAAGYSGTFRPCCAHGSATGDRPDNFHAPG